MPELKTVYRRYMKKDEDGNESEKVDELKLSSVDAHFAVREHPDEYSWAHPYEKPAPATGGTAGNSAAAQVKKLTEAVAKHDGDIATLSGQVQQLSKTFEDLIVELRGPNYKPPLAKGKGSSDK